MFGTRRNPVETRVRAATHRSATIKINFTSLRNHMAIKINFFKLVALKIVTIVTDNKVIIQWTTRKLVFIHKMLSVREVKSVLQKGFSFSFQLNFLCLPPGLFSCLFCLYVQNENHRLHNFRTQEILE